MGVHQAVESIAGFFNPPFSQARESTQPVIGLPRGMALCCGPVAEGQQMNMYRRYSICDQDLFWDICKNLQAMVIIGFIFYN